MNDTATNHGAPTPPAPPTTEEIERLVRMHKEAAVLNRATIRTNFQQAIQDAVLSGEKKPDEETPFSSPEGTELGLLCMAFRAWAEGESMLGLS